MMQAHVFQLTGSFSLISTVALRAQAALAKSETPRLDWYFTLADIVSKSSKGMMGKERLKEQKRNISFREGGTRRIYNRAATND